MKIAIFGGSFDPPHKEHINLVKSAIESLSLDKLFIMPAHIPPHKKNKSLTSDSQRLQMCSLAFGKIKNIEISDYEIKSGGTSYTYLTCRHFKKLYPDAQIYWLVGTDMLRDFPNWKKPEDILSNVTLGVCARHEHDGWTVSEQETFYNKFKTNFEIINYNGKAVSSTDIRVFAQAGEDISFLTDVDIESYIKTNKIYSYGFAKEALSLEKPSRKAHSIRVAQFAAARAPDLGIDEKKAITAALFHDCAKNLDLTSPLLKDFKILDDVPEPVLHQYTGAYLAKEKFGITDEDIINSIKYHTSGRENMSTLEKLIFLSDLLEYGRAFDGIDNLRKLFFKDKDNIDECLYVSLKNTLTYLDETGGCIYPLTRRAYEYIARQVKIN